METELNCGKRRRRIESARVRSMEPILLTTRRLQLKSATPELAAADLNNRFEFSRLLQADVPQDWPPPLNDENSKAFTLRYLEENPDAAGWAAWYFLLPGKGNEKAKKASVSVGSRENLPHEVWLKSVIRSCPITSGWALVPRRQPP